MGFRALNIISTLLICVSAFAADREDFYAKGTADSVFTNDVKKSDIEGIEFFARDPLPTPTTEPEVQLKGVGANLRDANYTTNSIAATSAELVAKYGDPRNQVPILATAENAPPPFKAMMEAKAAGMNDLAVQYARQYARYIRDLKDRTSYMTGLIGNAMMVEGVLPRNSWANSPQFEEARGMVADVLRKEQEENPDLYNGFEKESLDEDLKLLLADKSMEEDFSLPSDIEGHRQKEEARLLEVRDEIIRSAPIDPKGKVTVAVFFRPGDERTVSTLRLAERLFQTSREDSNVKLMGFSLETISPDKLAELAYSAKSTFPMRQGSDLANKLNITSGPAFVFMAETTGEVLKISNLPAGVELYDIVKKMKGSRT